MGSSGTSSIPTPRETVDGEVLPPVAVNQTVLAVKDTVWDLDSVINTSTPAHEVLKMPIPADIDPEGDYIVLSDFRPAQAPPIPTPTTPVDTTIPEPVALLIVQGDMKMYHARSLEEPPVPFLEGEDADEVESGSTPPELPRKRARMVAAGYVPTLGLADEGFTFASVLESHVPAGPAKKSKCV